MIQPRHDFGAEARAVTVSGDSREFLQLAFQIAYQIKNGYVYKAI